MVKKNVKLRVTRKLGARRPKVYPRDKHMQKIVRRSELSIVKMLAGNERLYKRVIDGDRVNLWVGIGWVDAGEATHTDKISYPRVVG